MHNNEAFRRIRYALELDTPTTAAVFTAGQSECSEDAIESFSRKESDDIGETISDKALLHFLNGLIVHRRGGDPLPVAADETLTNNKILKKLRIAMELYEDEMLNIFGLANIQFSRHKLSSLFRKENHKHYRECNDNTLRQFLRGLATYQQRHNQTEEI
jgi:uncharacterized protein YehS (DUF1456 family)